MSMKGLFHSRKIKASSLVYTAYDVCSGCGAGLAYLPGSSDLSWTCASVLLGREHQAGHDHLSFRFFTFITEKNPSAHGKSTRSL